MNPGQWLARLPLDVVAPWNQWATTHNPNGTLTITWLAAASFGSPAACPPAAATSFCQDASSLNGTDHAKTWLENPVTCAGAPYNFGTFSARVSTCSQPCPCNQPFPPNCICGAGDGGPGSTWQDENGLAFVVNKSDIPGCTPPPEPCTDPGGGGGGGGGGTSDPMATLGSKGVGRWRLRRERRWRGGELHLPAEWRASPLFRRRRRWHRLPRHRDVAGVARAILVP